MQRAACTWAPLWSRTGCCTKCSVTIIIMLITEEKAVVVACRQPAALTPPFPGATAAAVLMVDKCSPYHKSGTKHNVLWFWCILMFANKLFINVLAITSLLGGSSVRLPVRLSRVTSGYGEDMIPLSWIRLTPKNGGYMGVALKMQISG